jgi:hypothetical protein
VNIVLRRRGGALTASVGFVSGPDNPPGPGEAFRRSIPNDERGIRFEIGKMVQYAQTSRADPVVVKTARTITQLCPAKDKRCEMQAIFQWTKDRYRYINDPENKEVISTAQAQLADIMTPPAVLRMILGDNLIRQMMHFGANEAIITNTENQIQCRGCYEPSMSDFDGIRPRTSGDCDEGATLLASLLLGAAIPARYRFGGHEGGDGGENWHHVWVQAQDEQGNWIDMDPTEARSRLGWYHPSFSTGSGIIGYVPIPTDD